MKLSIITINFNNVNGLRKTLRSIRSQNVKEFEYIVIDGGSTDGSVDLIQQNKDIIDYWVSEKDKGIYDAMNKGVERSTGDFIQFVNSGDQLHSADTVSDILKNDISSDLNFFKVKNLSNDETKFSIWNPPSEKLLSFAYLQDNPLHHPGAIIRKSIQLKYPYRIEFKICADRCFFIESLIFGNCTYSVHDAIINTMEPQSTSGGTHVNEMANENVRIAELLFTTRLYRDFSKIRWDILPTTERLIKYYGATKLICTINNWMMNILDLFKRKNS